MDKSIITILAALGFILCIIIFYEKSKLSAKEIPIIVVLSAFAALGRIPFAALPGIQPTTFMVMISGLVFGPLPGFMVGAMAALVSNMFLGQGPWTLWQMFAWSLCGFSSGLLSIKFPGIGLKRLAAFAFLWGILFGWIMNFWYWISFSYVLSLRSFIAVNATSVWFDLMHAAGNVTFMVLFGPSFIKILKNFRKRITVTYS